MNLSVRNEQRKILSACSLIEMGERYIFYTIQSLLIFYLIDQLHLAHAVGAKLAGTVFGMVYISALLGGYIAERLLSYYLAVFIGSLILIFGCWTMTSVHSENMLFVGLAFISISSGLIKSNVSSFIGKFYDHVHARESERDFGFNIFYMGINAGIAAATFFAIYLRHQYGFGGAFYVSLMVAILVSLVATVGFKFLKNHQTQHNLTLKSVCYTAILISSYIAFVIYLLKNPHMAAMMFVVVAVICAVILFISARNKQHYRVIASLIFFVLSTLYWCLYMQLFISLLLFIHYCVQHAFLGVPINTSQFVTVESIFVLLLGVVMGKLWIYFENKNKLVRDIDKFNISFLFIGTMFLLLYLAIMFSAPGAKIPAWPLLVGVFFMGASELSLSAIGLSMVTKIAPKGYVSLYMGIWLVTIGFGSKLAGQVSSYITVNQNIVLSKQAMSHGLLWFMGLSAAGMMVSFILRKPAILNENLTLQK
ncbi:MAG: hypothetical protein A3F13_03740 [Gammaproteobacteria bacterium RIFCSPHIGHO2_12_FULL_40_19]|nr:MAG: hypothetical protein A3F13_03740 [Gammaproteobacteria bacterium RIFCSPHIGHO2_12_FULL_40_19]